MIKHPFSNAYLTTLDQQELVDHAYDIGDDLTKLLAQRLEEADEAAYRAEHDAIARYETEIERLEDRLYDLVKDYDELHAKYEQLKRKHDVRD
jgi:predicted nuclease with TOPRIM domain